MTDDTTTNAGPVSEVQYRWRRFLMQHNGDGTVNVTGICISHRERLTVYGLDHNGFLAWAREEKTVDEALPGIGGEAKRFLTRGLCKACNKRLFGKR